MSMAGIVARFGQAARQHDVAVENGARAVGDRVLLVVAFGQHGVERGDRAAAFGAVAGAFHQLRQLGEHRGRIALGGGRLADGQRDLALRHGVAGQRIHDQQHILALVAEVFGDGGGVGGALQAHQRAGVGRGGDHHRARQAFLAEDVGR